MVIGIIKQSFNERISKHNQRRELSTKMAAIYLFIFLSLRKQIFSGLQVFKISQFRPLDVLKGICLLSFHLLSTQIHVDIARHLKETVLWINIHGAMGKQNIQAKNVYWPWMSLFSVKFLLNSASAVVVKRTIKTESIRKLSNFNSQWTKPLYQNILSNIVFFLHLSRAIDVFIYV